MLDELATVYLEVYAEPPYNSGPLVSEDAFRGRTGRQAVRDGFTIITAREGRTLVGFSFGLPFAAGAWWAGAATPPPGDVLAGEKFAVIELVVRKPWRGRGLGRRLLAELLAGRPEPFAILTAVAAAPARELYARWGWEQTGTAQHTPDADVMDQLVLRLTP